MISKIKDFLPGEEGAAGVAVVDNTTVINDVFWMFKTGAPWSDAVREYISCYQEKHLIFNKPGNILA